jgi:hypothetical protein
MGLLDRIHDGVIQETTHWDESEEKLVVHREQDVTDLLADNRKMFNSGMDGYTPSRDLQFAARIPLIVIEQWFRQGINFFDPNDWPKVERMLNSNEYLYLRVAPGAL